MAYAVTHVIVAIVILDIFRHYVFGLKKFPRYLLVIGGIAGLAPDADIPLTWIYNYFFQTDLSLHRLFTHSIVFVLIFLLLGAWFHYRENKKWAGIFYVIAAGWFIHMVLDCMFGSFTSYLWPFNTFMNFCPSWNWSGAMVSVDAIILLIWLLHEELHHRIKDYF